MNSIYFFFVENDQTLRWRYEMCWENGIICLGSFVEMLAVIDLQACHAIAFVFILVGGD